jgi:hypothetical protein
VCGLFEFVDERDGVVFHRDAAVALGVGDELVFAEAEFSGTLAWFEEGGGAEVGPIDRRSLEQLKGFVVGFSDGKPLGWKVPESTRVTPGATSSEPAPPTTRNRMLPAFSTAAIWRSVTPRSLSVSSGGGL